MTLKYLYAGANQTETSARKKGPVQSITTHADGSFSTSSWSILDPTGTLNYLHLKEWAIEEDAATPPRCFTGRAFDHKISRGPYTTGPGRQIEFDVDDLNGYLHLQPLRGASSKRPRETRSARMAWLLAATTGLSGLVFDNGMVNTDSAMLDETEYRGRYPDEILTDMCLTTRIFFVYWDHTAGQPSLFFDLPTATTNTSTLSLSNVASDCGAIDDPATTVYPVHPDPQLDTGASLVYCGVDLTYRNGRIYRHDATTHALYFGATDVHRVAVVTSVRIGLLSTAEDRAAAFLANSRYPQAKVTVTVKLPAAKLNLIEAGMRIQVRFAHMGPEGFDPAIYTRVTSKTWPMESTNGYYDVTLELSNRAITGAGGGGGTGGSTGPGGFSPWASTCTPLRETFTRTVGAGSWGISELGGTAWFPYYNGAAASVNGTDGVLAPTGSIGSSAIEEIGLPVAFPIHLRTKQKILAPDDGILQFYFGPALPYTGAPGNVLISLQETVGGSPNSLAMAAEIVGSGGVAAIGSTTYPFGLVDPINQWFWLELLIEARTLSVRAWLDGNSPGAYIVYTLAVLSGDLVLPTTLAVTAITSEIGTTTADWRVTLIELLCDTPDTGREIVDEFLGIGDGVRTTFTFQYPYQPRSPHVEVDNIHHLVTETDPTTGDIDLGFAPIAGETVTGSYRVA